MGDRAARERRAGDRGEAEARVSGAGSIMLLAACRSPGGLAAPEPTVVKWPRRGWRTHWRLGGPKTVLTDEAISEILVGHP